MEKLILFGILSLPIIYFSWRSIFSIKNHGFYRFFGWEGVLWMLISNAKMWFADPLGSKQIISWLLLIISIYYLIAGAILLLRKGRPVRSAERPELFQFEKTTQLIDTGLFKYIRHPLYGSLILLTWGILLKNVTLPLLVIALLCTVLFYLTALFDEKECIQFFGDRYIQYMKRSKMFIPFLF